MKHLENDIQILKRKKLIFENLMEERKYTKKIKKILNYNMDFYNLVLNYTEEYPSKRSGSIIQSFIYGKKIPKLLNTRIDKLYNQNITMDSHFAEKRLKIYICRDCYALDDSYRIRI